MQGRWGRRAQPATCAGTTVAADGPIGGERGGGRGTWFCRTPRRHGPIDLRLQGGADWSGRTDSYWRTVCQMGTSSPGSSPRRDVGDDIARAYRQETFTKITSEPSPVGRHQKAVTGGPSPFGQHQQAITSYAITSRPSPVGPHQKAVASRTSPVSEQQYASA